MQFRITGSYPKALLLVAALGLPAFGAVAQPERNPAHKAPAGVPTNSSRVIVKFRPDAFVVRMHALSAAASASDTRDILGARASALGTRVGLALVSGRGLDQHTQVVTAAGLTSAQLAERLSADAEVEYAVPDERRYRLVAPNDTYYTAGPAISGTTGGPAAGQWYLRAPAGDIVSSINAPGAWDRSTGSASVVVAVLDTGVRPEHPDLAGRLLPGYDMISDSDVANDGGGRDADASDPGDWVTTIEANNTSGPFHGCEVSDSSWHGTMTTSLVGALTNNGAGMAGVAGSSPLLPVRVLGKCGGYDSDIIAGMNWAAGLSVPGVPANPNPARVLNLSLGSTGSCPSSYTDAINAITTKANPAVIVMSAGNSTGHAVGVPANCPGVIAVAGLRHNGNKVGYSDLGPEIAISAPGGNCVNTGASEPCLYPILAATNTGTTTPLASSYTDSFNVSIGTSFAAPLVAGTAALMLSVNPALTPAQVKSLLQQSARAFPSGVTLATDPIPVCAAPSSTDQLECHCTTSTCGAGMLDAAAAVAAAGPASGVYWGAAVNQFASRATVTPSAPVYGGFALVNPTNLYIAVRGPSLHTLGITNNYLPRPQLNLYNQSGTLLATSNQCSGTTADNAAVVNYYRNTRLAPLDANDACLGYSTTTLPAGVYTFTVTPDASAANGSGEVLFETSPVGTGAMLTQFASRATVAPSAPVYGGFALTNPSNLYIAVRGPSLGTLGITSNALSHPQLALYSQSGTLLATNNHCAGSGGDSTSVISYYQNIRRAALDANDTCLGWISGTLPAGVYTFVVQPDASTPTGTGEVLFETTPPY